MDNVNDWDGWKILLLQLGLGFDLPQTRWNDPFYTPTPPRVSQTEMSNSGQVRIKFSEPVFRLDRVTEQQIGVGRRLQDAGLKPFLDIEVLAGENSDPEQLGLQIVSSTWTDDETIDIFLKFDTPVAVSA